MTGLKRFASERPVPFSFVVALVVLAFYVIVGVLAAVVTDDAVVYQLVEALGRFAASCCFLYVLWRLGWSSAAGVTRTGAWQVWLLMLPVLAYEILSTTYAVFGDVSFGFSDPELAGSVVVNNMTVGLIEEVACRGIILYAMMRLWGDSPRGIVKSVIVSSLLFGSLHLIHILLGKPVPLAAFQTLNAFLGGIFFSVIVLHARSIWPVVIYHGLSNALFNARAFEIPGFEETIPMWLSIIALQIPIVILSVILLRRASPRPVVPATA